MSKYEWEKGQVKIPSAQWGSFRRELHDALAKELERRFEFAQALYTHLKSTGKGKRKFDYLKEAHHWAEAQSQKLTALSIIGFVLPRPKEGRHKPRTPKKKDFQVQRSVLEINHPALRWEGCLMLDPKTRTAHWRVDENNYACDRAWGHPMGVAFARALSHIR